MKTIIYIPFYNSDMTEGCGPMIACDFGFSDKVEGNNYIDGQPGIMGSKGKWSSEKFGDWQLRPFVIFKTREEAEQNTKAKRIEKALSKLDEDDKKLLGLI